MSNRKIQASRIENGIEICNTCVRPADRPFRYLDSHSHERGCISECHDKHIRINTKPNWMAPRYVLPKWVTEARRQIREHKQWTREAFILPTFSEHMDK